MINVYILLERSDIKWCLNIVKDSDIVLTDLPCDGLFKTIITPKVSDEKATTLEVIKWYRYESTKKNISLGYVNNLYECSIRPLLGYLDSISKIVKNHQPDITFHLRKKPLLSSKTSTYFLSEYESMGTYLYDRSSTFTPYIISYLKDQNLPCRLNSIHFYPQSYFLGPARRAAVLVYRYINSVKASLKDNKPHNKKNVTYDCCFILRTIGQAKVISGYLNQTKRKVIIIIANSSLNDDAHTYLKNNLTNDNIDILKCPNPSIKYITRKYFSYLIRRSSPSLISIGSSRLNLTNAIKEVKIMRIELEIYKNQIVKAINSISFHSNAKCYSLEFTSPHAYVDTEVAKIKGMIPIQIQPCDRAFRPLPYPVFSELLCVKTKSLEHSFSKCWPEEKTKIKYVGTFSKNGSKKKAIEKTRQRNNICIFTGAHKKENINLIKTLKSKDILSENEIYIKRHPRDNFNYANLKEIKEIDESSKNINEQLENIDLAITFPSAVISEIIMSKTPFLVYIPKNIDYINAENNMDKNISMFPHIHSKNELKCKIKNYSEVSKEHAKTLISYMKSSGLVFDPIIIDSNIDRYINTLHKTKSNIYLKTTTSRKLL